jgi:hypothetical protein
LCLQAPEPTSFGSNDAWTLRIGCPSRAAEDPSQPAESAERVLRLAREYDFYADAQRRTKFVLQSQPLLTYSNPVRGEVYGNVFVWTWHGRPEVVGAIFDYRSENRFDSELHTLARAGVVGCRNGESFWNPSAAGVTFQPVPDAPPPAATHAARLRQMREFAKDFTVERNHPEQMTGLMRLLPQPIYRYSAEAAQHPDGIVDGALFTFVEATDPEAYLLLEAAAGEDPQWRFGFARMNIVEFRALYRGKTVWQVTPVTWDEVFDKQEPYAIVREVPRRGLVRSR